MADKPDKQAEYEPVVTAEQPAEVPLRGPYAEWRGPYETMTDTAATAAAQKADAEATAAAKAAEVEAKKAATVPEPKPVYRDEPEPRRPTRG